MLAVELFLLDICNTKIEKENKCKNSAKDSVPVPIACMDDPPLYFTVVKTKTKQVWKIHVFDSRASKVLSGCLYPEF